MKQVFLTSILTLLIFSTFGQKNIIVKWGPELKAKSNTYISSVLGADEEAFYTLRKPRKGITDNFWIEKYSKKNMALLYSKELLLPMAGKKIMNYENIFMFNGKFLLLTSFYDKKEDKNTAFASIISKDGVMNPKYTEIGSIDASKKNTSSFGFEVSRDKSKLLVFKNEEYSDEANESFSYKMLGPNLETLWTKSIELEHSDEYVEISDYSVDNDGMVYALTKIYPDRNRGEKKMGRKMQQYKYTIIAYNPETDKTEQFKIDLGPDKFVSDIGYSLTTDRRLVVVGFYSRENSSSMDGTFFISIDPSSQTVKETKLKEFDREFLLEFLKEREVNKDEELTNFYFKDMLLKEDGGFYIVAEQEYMVIESYTDANGNRSYTYHYYSNDLIVMNFDADGDILWSKKVAKKQHTTNDGGEYNSYAMAWTNEHLHFFFNDDEDNSGPNMKNPTKMHVMKNPKKAVTTLVSMDQTGSFKRGPLFTAKDFGTILQPKLNYSVENSEIIIFGEKGSKYKFGMINFKDYN